MVYLLFKHETFHRCRRVIDSSDVDVIFIHQNANFPLFADNSTGLKLLCFESSICLLWEPNWKAKINGFEIDKLKHVQLDSRRIIEKAFERKMPWNGGHSWLEIQLEKKITTKLNLDQEILIMKKIPNWIWFPTVSYTGPLRQLCS